MLLIYIINEKLHTDQGHLNWLDRDRRYQKEKEKGRAASSVNTMITAEDAFQGFLR